MLRDPGGETAVGPLLTNRACFRADDRLLLSLAPEAGASPARRPSAINGPKMICLRRSSAGGCTTSAILHFWPPDRWSRFCLVLHPRFQGVRNVMPSLGQISKQLKQPTHRSKSTVFSFLSMHSDLQTFSQSPHPLQSPSSMAMRMSE